MAQLVKQVKNLPAMQEIQERWVRYLGQKILWRRKGNGKLLQYSCWKNPMEWDF